MYTLFFFPIFILFPHWMILECTTNLHCPVWILCACVFTSGQSRITTEKIWFDEEVKKPKKKTYYKVSFSFSWFQCFVLFTFLFSQLVFCLLKKENTKFYEKKTDASHSLWSFAYKAICSASVCAFVVVVVFLCFDFLVRFVLRLLPFILIFDIFNY